MDFHSVNISGRNIARIRSELKTPLTQEQLAAKLQTLGLDIDRAAIAKIETQKRRVYDIEIVLLAKALQTTVSALLSNE